MSLKTPKSKNQIRREQQLKDHAEEYKRSAYESFKVIHKFPLDAHNLNNFTKIIRSQHIQGVQKTLLVESLSNRFKIHEIRMPFGKKFIAVFDNELGLIKEFRK